MFCFLPASVLAGPGFVEHRCAAFWEGGGDHWRQHRHRQGDGQRACSQGEVCRLHRAGPPAFLARSSAHIPLSFFLGQELKDPGVQVQLGYQLTLWPETFLPAPFLLYKVRKTVMPVYNIGQVGYSKGDLSYGKK